MADSLSATGTDCCQDETRASDPTTLEIDSEMNTISTNLATSHIVEGDPKDIPACKVQNNYSHYRLLDHTKKEIRLVALAPGSFDDPLSCTLTRHSLPPADVQFEALSYCWGDLKDTVPITLRHEYAGDLGERAQVRYTAEQTFNITKSLDLALRSLRYEGRVRVIWIDALCINQGSTRERNYAIPFMVDVYKSAHSVLIFLGGKERKKNFVRIWQLMNMMRSAVERSLQAQGKPEPLAEQDLDIQDLVKSMQIVSKTENHKGDEIFRVHMALAFEEFFEYSWFQRVWVVQEALNARKAMVYFNGQEREWLDVLIFLCVAVNHSRSYAGVWTGKVDLRDRLPPFLWTKLIGAKGAEKSTPRLPLLELLSRGRAFQATDPRDKVFALLSFGQETYDLDQLHPRLRPDYTKTASEVWRDVTRQWIIDNESLDILGVLLEEVDKQNQAAPGSTIVVGQGKIRPLLAVQQAPLAHPSWALWHAGHPAAALIALFRLGQKLGKCSFPMNISPLTSPHDSAILSLRGMALDKVQTVQWPFKRWLISDEDISQFDHETSTTSIAGGIPIAWGILIGLIELDDETKKATVKVNKKLSVGAYPNGSNILQSFIETLICKRFSREFFLAGDDDRRYKEFVSLASCLDNEATSQEKEPEKLNGSVEVDKGCRDDLMALAHFAAHWSRSRSDPDMKWIPEPLARRLQALVKYGTSKKFTEMCSYAEGRCFFRLRSGAFGLCPQGTREGDWVVSLSGGNTPFVLRPVMSDEGEPTNKNESSIQDHKHELHRPESRWTLVGECYVHDLDICRITKVALDKGTDSIKAFHIV
jgi:hypothetical protein